MKREKILFINPFTLFSDILEEEGYEIITVQASAKAIEKKIWIVQPFVIIISIGDLDFDGISPLKMIPPHFWKRTLAISNVVDAKTLSKEVKRFGCIRQIRPVTSKTANNKKIGFTSYGA